MTTEFGKELRKLRIDRDETLATMAKKMDISISYLSAIENGMRDVPEGFIQKISKKYHLSKKDIDSLSEALNHSLRSIDISLEGMMSMQRDLAVMLARKLPDITEDDCEKILSMLKETK